MNNQPLVSIPIVTYNSSKYILETLESIKSQTYSNIELIVSDDCSTDDTVSLCRHWIALNKNRFARTLIIEATKNMGVSANSNRGEYACTGDWIKDIAGDDILLPTCISDYVNYIQENPNIIYAFSRIETFGDNKFQNSRISQVFNNNDFWEKTAKEQHRYLLDSNCVPASTCFYNRLKSKQLKISNDERIPFLEDWPKWINITRKGVKLYLLDKVTVKYRVRPDSLSTGGTTERMQKSYAQFYIYYQFCYHFHQYPRLAIIKYIKAKQFLSKNKYWYIVENIVRIADFIYCKIKKSQVDDWKNASFQ